MGSRKENGSVSSLLTFFVRAFFFLSLGILKRYLKGCFVGDDGSRATRHGISRDTRCIFNFYLTGIVAICLLFFFSSLGFFFFISCCSAFISLWRGGFESSTHCLLGDPPLRWDLSTPLYEFRPDCWTIAFLFLVYLAQATAAAMNGLCM